MSKSIIQQKSFSFALLVIDTYKYLVQNKQYVLGKQFLRSGTSILSKYGRSTLIPIKKRIFAKMSIVYREASETKYWVNLLIYAGYLPDKNGINLLERIDEIIKITGSIRKSILKQITS